MSSEHPLFDPQSMYSMMRATFPAEEKVFGFFLSRVPGRATPAIGQKGGSGKPAEADELSLAAGSEKSRKVPQGVGSQSSMAANALRSLRQHSRTLRVTPDGLHDEPAVKVDWSGLQPVDSWRLAGVSDGTHLLFVTDDNRAGWLSTEGESRSFLLPGSIPMEAVFAIAPDGSMIVGRKDGTIQRLDFLRGTTAETEISSGEITAVAAFPDGRVVVGSVDATVKLWNPDDGIVHTMHEHTDRVQCVAVHPDGRIVSGSGDGTVKVWNPDDGTVRTMHEHTAHVQCVAVHPDGRIVSGSWDRTVKVWNPDDGTVRTMDEHTDSVMCVAMHPAGRIVSGSRDRTVKVWNQEDGTIATMAEHAGSVTWILLLADGRIVSGGDQPLLRIWNPEAGKVETIDRLPFHRVEVSIERSSSDRRPLPFRCLIISRPALERLCEAAGIEEASPRHLQEMLGDSSLLKQPDFAEILAGLPELEGELNRRGNGTACALVPDAAADLDDDVTLLVLLQDGGQTT